MSCLGSPIKKVASFGATPNLGMQWFAVYTNHRHEKRVSELLAERGIDTVLPLYQVTRTWKKSAPVVLNLPLFPCYLFVHLNQSDRSSVLRVPGVVSIVGSPTEPWPLSTADIDALRLGGRLAVMEPHPYLRLGEMVRIKRGPMAGVQGILSRKKNEVRVVLTLEALMRSVAIEVDANDLEVIDQFAFTGKGPREK